MSDDYQRGFFTQEAWEPILADKSRGEKIKIRANCFNYSAVVDADPGQEWQKVLKGQCDKTERYIFPSCWADDDSPEDELVGPLCELCAHAFRAACSQLQKRYGYPADEYADALVASQKYRFLGSSADVERSIARVASLRSKFLPGRIAKEGATLMYVTFGFPIIGALALIALFAGGSG